MVVEVNGQEWMRECQARRTNLGSLVCSLVCSLVRSLVESYHSVLEFFIDCRLMSRQL